MVLLKARGNILGFEFCPLSIIPIIWNLENPVRECLNMSAVNSAAWHCWLFKCFQYFYKSCLWSVRAWTLMALIWLLAMSLSCNFNFEIKDKKCEESNALGLFPFFFNQFLFFLFCSALLNQIRQLRSSRGFPLSFPHHNKVLQS